jgi:hypothetical protein
MTSEFFIFFNLDHVGFFSVPLAWQSNFILEYLNKDTQIKNIKIAK